MEVVAITIDEQKVANCTVRMTRDYKEWDMAVIENTSVLATATGVGILPDAISRVGSYRNSAASRVNGTVD